MSKIVTVFNEKGGCGKTTVACHLAGTFGLRGLDVLVADLDAQQTSAAWLAAREGANIKATIWPGFRYGASITGEIQKLSSHAAGERPDHHPNPPVTAGYCCAARSQTPGAPGDRGKRSQRHHGACAGQRSADAPQRCSHVFRQSGEGS